MALAPRQGRHAPAAPSRLEDSPALADICSEGWVGRCVAYSGRRRGRRSGLHCKLLLASASPLLSSNKGPAPIPCPRLFYPTPTPGYPLTHHSGCSNLQPSRGAEPARRPKRARRRSISSSTLYMTHKGRRGAEQVAYRGSCRRRRRRRRGSRARRGARG